MSATLTQRTFRWGAWWGQHQIDGMALVGFRHWCGGSPTLVDFYREEYHGDCCDGCGTIIERPDRECTPIYGPKGGDDG